jgi:hypothetical protein
LVPDGVDSVASSNGQVRATVHDNVFALGGLADDKNPTEVTWFDAQGREVPKGVRRHRSCC